MPLAVHIHPRIVVHTPVAVRQRHNVVAVAVIPVAVALAPHGAVTGQVTLVVAAIFNTPWEVVPLVMLAPCQAVLVVVHPVNLSRIVLHTAVAPVATIGILVAIVDCVRVLRVYPISTSLTYALRREAAKPARYCEVNIPALLNRNHPWSLRVSRRDDVTTLRISVDVWRPKLCVARVCVLVAVHRHVRHGVILPAVDALIPFTSQRVLHRCMDIVVAQCERSHESLVVPVHDSTPCNVALDVLNVRHRPPERMVIDHIRVHPILLLVRTPVVQRRGKYTLRHARMRERICIPIAQKLLRGLAHDAAHLLCTLCVAHTAHQLRPLILLHLFSYQACCHIGKQ